ncbi:Outer dynein arm-docking complex subunit 4 like protein [Aduncisulcus paluster]|uniref:Outer dynein arm-docking complex subunit 4 n=1 Tax=Aduncisulcus paluster TaxID=2918883 RepID=A0ABQ5KJ13_9EUKA|nr:Outer dynein arm-docking complex subunit 4 like protein [Aduncisulcus paluster]
MSSERGRIFFDEGLTCFRAGNFARAVYSFNQALEFLQGDRNILLWRSRAYVALGQPQKAIDDADECIGKDTKFHRGLFQKGEALFSAGDFEFALMFYHRAHRLRTDIEKYKLGIQKAEAAINRAIEQELAPETGIESGEDEETVYDIDGQASSHLSISQADEESAVSSDHDDLDIRKMRDRLLQDKQAPPDPLAHKAIPSRRLLGALYDDHLFLNKMMKDRVMTDAATGKVRQIMQKGLNYLDSRIEFWRQQKPPVPQGAEGKTLSKSRRTTRRRQPKPPSCAQTGIRRDLQAMEGKLTKDTDAQSNLTKDTTLSIEGGEEGVSGDLSVHNQGMEKEKRLSTVYRFISETLNNVREAVASNAPHLALQFCVKLRDRLTKGPGEWQTLPDREQVLADVFSAMGCIYFDQEKYDQAVIHFRKSLDLSEHASLPMKTARALRNLGRTLQRLGEIVKAAPLYNRVLNMGTVLGPFVRGDAALQIGRCYFEAEEWDQAVSYGQKALEMLLFSDSRGGADSSDSASKKYANSQDELEDFQRHAPSFFSRAEQSRNEDELDSRCLIGRALFMLGKVDESKATLEECLALSKEFEDPTAQAAALANLSSIYNHLGEAEKAEQMRKEAEEASKMGM